MRKVFGRAFAGVVVLALLVVFVPSTRAATVNLEPEEQEFLRLINNYRKTNGLTELQVSKSLTDAAKFLSSDMANKSYFNHTDSLGRSASARVRAFGYTFNTYTGENIAAGYSSAQNTFDQWKASSGHNANMLLPEYKAIGIGRYANPQSPYRYYWTTDFGGVVEPVGATTTTPITTPTSTPVTVPTSTPTTGTPSINKNPLKQGAFRWVKIGNIYVAVRK